MNSLESMGDKFLLDIYLYHFVDFEASRLSFGTHTVQSFSSPMA